MNEICFILLLLISFTTYYLLILSFLVHKEVLRFYFDMSFGEEFSVNFDNGAWKTVAENDSLALLSSSDRRILHFPILPHPPVLKMTCGGVVPRPRLGSFTKGEVFYILSEINFPLEVNKSGLKYRWVQKVRITLARE